MMVVCKDRIERNQQRQQMGIEAAAVVESDIANLLAGKSYEHLVMLQRQIQAKLVSREPMDVEYWEGLLKKLLVYKAQVIFHLQCRRDCTDAPRSQNLRHTMKLLFRIAWSSFASDSGTRPYEPSRNSLPAQLPIFPSIKSHPQLSKNPLLRRLNRITDP